MTPAVDDPPADVCLQLRSFGVAYHARPVLTDVTLNVPSRGVVALVGPTGTGKSTLLRTLAGYNRTTPCVSVWGECRYLGMPLGAAGHPALVVQHARLFTSTLLENLLQELPERFASTTRQKRDRAHAILEQIGLSEFESQLDAPVLTLPLPVQRLVSIARVAAGQPALLCVDEPTNGVDQDGVGKLLEYLQDQAAQRAVIVVLHNQKEIRALGGTTALLASGVIQEAQATSEFFKRPVSVAGQQFVTTGSCVETSAAARSEDPPQPQPPRERSRPMGRDACSTSAALGPHGFVWLLPGQLAGTPQPGIQFALEYDLDALRRVGITVLISLTEHQLRPLVLAEFGIRSLWYPVKDMEAPIIATAKHVCARIDRLLAGGDVVAIHCKAGLGRTGTLLVAYLIWRGHSALTALELARRSEPRWVQSDAQVRFLEEFSHELGRQHPVAGTELDTAPAHRAHPIV